MDVKEILIMFEDDMEYWTCMMLNVIKWSVDDVEDHGELQFYVRHCHMTAEIIMRLREKVESDSTTSPTDKEEQ